MRGCSYTSLPSPSVPKMNGSLSFSPNRTKGRGQFPLWVSKWRVTRGRVRNEYAFALTQGHPGWRSSFVERVSCSGNERDEWFWSTRSGRFLTSWVVRVERWFGGEGDRRVVVCSTTEEVARVSEEDMKADSGTLRTARFQKSSRRIAPSIDVRNTLANGGSKRVSVPNPK